MVKLNRSHVRPRHVLAVASAAGLLFAGLMPSAAADKPDPAASAAVDYVEPIKWQRFGQRPAPSEPADLVADALRNANKYAVTTFWQERYADQTGPYLDLGGTGEVIRQPASQAYAIAIALQTGAYDADVTGVPADEARAIAVRLATSVAFAHKATSAGGWGDVWQSALWAYYAGNAAWLLWDELSPADRGHVADMLVAEADRFLNYQVPYYRDPNGSVNFRGDSKAEENAWNANLLQLVTAMMPEHPRQAQWMDKNIELMISAFARPADLQNDDVLHGRPVRDWLNGSNIADNGTLVNHGFIHPDYMATVAMNASGPLTYGLAGMHTPEASRFNADIVYGALSSVNFSSPPYAAPGGTIYVFGANGEPSANIYYPQGNDWGTHRRAHFVVVDATAHLFGYDGLSQGAAAEWERLHVQTILDMQARGTDGRTYQAPGEDTYAGREPWVAVETARAHLAHWLAAQGAVRWTDEAHPRVTVDVNAPDAIPAGDDGLVDVSLRPELTDDPAVRVSLAVEAPDDVSVEAEGPTTWAMVPGSGVSTRLRVTPDADAAGHRDLTVRVDYRLDGKRRTAERTVTLLVPPPAPDADTWLSDVPWTSVSNGYGPALLDENYYRNPLGVAGVSYPKGLWTHAPAQVDYFLGGQCQAFTAVLGIDDSMHDFGADFGSVVYRVLLDGEVVFDSGLVTGSMDGMPLTVDATGAQMMRLVVTNGGLNGQSYDHAVWANARLTCSAS